MDNVIPWPVAPRDDPGEPELLWREVVGQLLHDRRHARCERIADVADRAGISPQYLSELERGRKDASSEILAAVTGALGLSMLDLTRRAGSRLARAATRPSGPVCLAA